MQRFPTNTSAKAGQDRLNQVQRSTVVMAQTDNKKSWLLGASYKWNNM